MSGDSYRVEVIHYLNPHLIWVEVLDSANTKDEYLFEQVGLYGILPLEKTLDIEFEELKIQKCDNWTPAATKIFKDIFNDSTEVWFSPTHIDRRTSIFDDNIHKYGELLVKHKDGKLKKISKLLIKTNLAYFNVHEFHHKLSSGNLNTKLSLIKTEEVVREIEKFYTNNNPKLKSEKEKAVKKQTSVFQISQDFESLLTVSNIEKHNNEMLRKLLEKKAMDFELCKEVDEESVGCGFKPRSDLKNNACKQRQTAYGSNNNYEEAFNDIKTFATTNLVAKCDTESQVSELDDKQSALSAFLNKRIHIYKKKEQMNKSVSDKNESTNNASNVSTEIIETLNTEDEVTFTNNKQPSGHKNKVSLDKNESKITHEKNEVDSEQFSKEEEISKKSPNMCKPSENMRGKKYMMQVAYGPPGLDPYKYKIELKSLDQDEYYFNNTKAEPKEMVFTKAERKEMEFDRNNMFANSESDVDMHKTDKIMQNDFVNQMNNGTDDKEEITKTKESILNKVTSNTCSTLQMKLKTLENCSNNKVSSSSHTLTTKSVNSDSDEDIDEIYKRINAKYKINPTDNTEEKQKEVPTEEVLVKYNVNPFRNFDTDISVFVDKLVSPVLMVHLKINRRVQPVQSLRDVCFNKHIHEVFKNMFIKGPMMIQTVSWPIILRGYSLFMVSPPNSGKTMGYLPAVCRLVSDSSSILDSHGPIAIIVCATAKLVANVERMAKMFLGLEDRVLACYSGVDDLYVTTSLLNGCDLLIATPVYLWKLFQMSEYGVDLRRLSIFVLDDCERLFTMYEDEIKTFQIKIKKMLKKRTQKELKVQYILASRVWCDNMEALALKAPDTVICIGAFQECVLYSKTDMSVSFIKNDKLKYLLDYLQNIDRTKKTVIVCNSDDEVEMLEKALQSSQQIVFASNNKMSVHDLYNLSVSWSHCNVPLRGPILICCDGNLTHMNITDAHNLVHFSLPQLYSMFCKRFSVLNDNYPSIFKNNNDVVKIKIFVENNNAEQLPKIINFIKRCTDVPNVLDGVCKDILKEKDVVRAENLVPLCDRILMLGECPDIFYCNERHTILKDYDMPLEWLPTEGFVTFKILHYSSATSYSGRIFTNIANGNVVKYPQTYSALSLKMGMYYCKEVNRKLHGYPKVGDICAVSIKLNLYARCQVVKILNTYEKGNPNNVLVKLIDEEWYEVTRDINLYHLPEELKAIKTHVAQIRLINISPMDNDITFTDLTKNHIKKIIESEEDLFLRGHIALTIGPCIFVDTLEVCQHLASLNEVVVKHNIKHELLKNHAILNEDILPCLKKMCIESGIPVTGKTDTELNVTEENIHQETDMKIISEGLERKANFEEKTIKESHDYVKKDQIREFENKKLRVSDKDPDKKPVSTNSFTKVAKDQLRGEWASFESNDLNLVVIGSSKTPEQFFLRRQDFECSMKTLLDNIEKYVANVNSTEVVLREGEIVLARFPDDTIYERARIDEIDGDNVKCFFLDQGDWIDIPKNHLLPITEDIINQVPFQAIECKLLGVRAPNDKWIDSTNKWFYDYCYEDGNGKLKFLYAKYYTKETAEFTGGFKYGVVLFDTNGEKDVLINQLMIDLNIAKENAVEVQYLKINNILNATNVSMSSESCNESEIDNEIIDLPSSSQIYSQKLIRSVPLVNSDNSDDDEDKWDVNLDSGAFKNIASNMVSEASTLINKEITFSTEISNPTDHYMKSEKTEATNNTCLLTTKQASELLPVNHNPTETNLVRKPKLLWRQNKNTVSISILIDVDTYHLQINDRRLKFSTELNNAKYEFDIELYGVIDKDKSTHVKKGLVIWVVLEKYIKKNWLALVSTRESSKNWITYDVSVLDASSDEEEVCDTKDLENYIRKTREECSESEDDEFKDDLQR